MVFGKATATAIDLASVAAGTGGFVINGQAAGDQSGWSVASAGDVNGDGLGDLIVGAYQSDPASGVDAGRSYVVFGKAGTAAMELASIAAGTGGFVINGQAASDISGYSVASAGDVNGDGLADLIVGAQSSDPASGLDAGRSYVVFGKAGTAAIDLASIAAGTGGFVINGQAANDHSGVSAASAGDVNGDGLGDLIVGAHVSDPANGVDAGRSYVVFGKAGTTAIDLASVALGTGGFVINGQAVSDYSGISVASAGDIHGDGLGDLIVGAYASDPAGGVDAGRSYVVFGKAGTTAINLASVALGTGGFVINGQAAGDNSGTSVASAGDVDGDGLGDLIVGAPYSDPAAGTNAGRSYVILSSQIGQGNFGQQLTTLGTSGADTLAGTTGVDRIAAGAGNDTITAGGGADVIYGGAGNDTITLNASNLASLGASRIDGGLGLDTVKLDASTTGLTLDFSALSSQVFKGIEVIDLANGVANTVKLNLANLRGLHDESGAAGGFINRLLVNGEAGDVVQLAFGSGTWSASGTETVNAVAYNVYANSLDTLDKLLVQQGMSTSILGA